MNDDAASLEVAQVTRLLDQWGSNPFARGPTERGDDIVLPAGAEAQLPLLPDPLDEAPVAVAGVDFSATPRGCNPSDPFRLTRLQLFNWGTFSGLFALAIAPQGYLFMGGSGAGKSTLLDAHSTLTTPPNRMDLNAASRGTAKGGRDRNIVTYVRGAWGTQTNSEGEHAKQFLRTGATWSALGEVFTSPTGKVVSIAQVLWIKGSGTAVNDVSRAFLITERTLDLEELQFFVESGYDIRKFKTSLPDVQVYREFTAYQEKMRRLLGIDNEQTLMLLHKTQSAKQLDDLNEFLRVFMLDTPQTFAIADATVLEFQQLREAHRAVLDAKQQIDILGPAKLQWDRVGEVRATIGKLQNQKDQNDTYTQQLKLTAFTDLLCESQVVLKGQLSAQEQFNEIAAIEEERYRELLAQKAGMDSNALDQLVQAQGRLLANIPRMEVKQKRMEQASATIGWVTPDSAALFGERSEAARQELDGGSDKARALEADLEALIRSRVPLEDKFAELRKEVESLERQRSSIPRPLLEMRERMAQHLRLPVEEFPFIGELAQVKEGEAAWRGAIERAMGSQSRCVLVQEHHYERASAFVNESNLGGRLVYQRMRDSRGGTRILSRSSLLRKVELAPGKFQNWLEEHLLGLFHDTECVDNMDEFRAASRALTREGQVKNGLRHEKDDRHHVSDRTQWVMGFDNSAKLEAMREQAFQYATEIGTLNTRQTGIRDAQEELKLRGRALQQLADLSWDEVDVAGARAKLKDTEARIEQEKSAHPELQALEDKLLKQADTLETANGAKNECAGKVLSTRSAIAGFERKRDSLRAAYPRIDEPVPSADALQKRYAKYEQAGGFADEAAVLTASKKVGEAINADMATAVAERTGCENSIERSFTDFNRLFPAQAEGLDAKLDSAPDYFAKLERLQTDGLPRFEDKFFDLMRNQSDQNITRLAFALNQERSAIRERMDTVNDSLKLAPFNVGTHLSIQTLERSLEDVREFNALVRKILDSSLSASLERTEVEKRFEHMRGLIERLESQELKDRNWRNLVLDVRQHVEFIARESDQNLREVRVYRSSEGLSGGQKQKLTATCLAAALRYQLGGVDADGPTYSTVVIDEAFSNADADFTDQAMNIFQTFGFQMIVATPNKSVMSLEPYIGGACLVQIDKAGGKRSGIIPIEYNQERMKLLLEEKGIDPNEIHDA